MDVHDRRQSDCKYEMSSHQVPRSLFGSTRLALLPRLGCLHSRGLCCAATSQLTSLSEGLQQLDAALVIPLMMSHPHNVEALRCHLAMLWKPCAQLLPPSQPFRAIFNLLVLAFTLRCRRSARFIARYCVLIPPDRHCTRRCFLMLAAKEWQSATKGWSGPNGWGKCEVPTATAEQG